ncbi:MAG: AAA family ATPase [Eubacterium sp.]|nr:AAA family ATPase [Eubacterium sp.]
MKKKDKTIEVLNEINNMEKNLLSGMYRDFFEDAKKKKAGDLTFGEGKPGEKDPFTEEALNEARDALNEFYQKVDEVNAGSGRENASSDTAEAQVGEEPTAQATASQAEQPPQEPEEDPMETLDNLIGLQKIKHDVKELTAFAKVQKARQDAGLKSVPVSLHLVFTGNPGTGKTTVARIIAKLYKQIGVLSQGQLIEVDRSGLVAGYVGQTALKTQEQIQKALGGVLFIDEAYALSQKDDAFGQEAIETILKAMEDHRDNLVVIVAGYTEPMRKFIDSNPGLKSRFNKYIEFSDYTIDELMGIFDMNCKKYDYTIEEDTRKHVREMIVAKKLAAAENFANAREVRNLFEEIITNQARRVAGMESPSQEDMMKIMPEDLLDEEEAKISKAAEDAEAELAASETEPLVESSVTP